MAIQTLNITKSGNGSGTVTSNVGIPAVNCGDTCSVSQTSGSNVTLTATPARGSRFVRWTGDVNSTSNPVTYNQTLNPTNINAEFSKRGSGRAGAFLPIVWFLSSQFNGIPQVIRYKGVIYYFYKTQGNYIGFTITPPNQRSAIGYAIVDTGKK